MKPDDQDPGPGGIGASFESFLDEEGIKDEVTRRAEKADLVRQIGIAADKIWEVGKIWSSWGHDSFPDDMKGLSDRLHGVRHEFEVGQNPRRVAEVEYRKLRRIGAEVFTARQETGGDCGELLQQAYEIIVALVEKPKSG